MVRRSATAWVALALAAGSALAITACGGGGDDGAPELGFSRLTAANYSVWPQQSYVVRSAAQWQAAWDAYEPGANPKPARPEVDFGTQMVVGLSLGWGPDGCHRVQMRRIVNALAEVRVEYVHTRGISPPAIACTLAIVPLTDFVSVTRSDKPVRFVEVDI